MNASEIHSILLNVLLTSVQSRLGRAASRALRFKQVLLQVAESQECFVKLAIIGCVLRTTSCYTSPQLVECVAQIKALLIYNYLVAIVTVPRWQMVINNSAPKLNKCAFLFGKAQGKQPDR